MHHFAYFFFFHFLQNNQESEAAVLDQTAMAIFISTNDDPLHPTKDIKIIIDGVEVLAELPSVATAFAMLFGLIYTLNLRYPKQLQFTFEFVQKVLMELEAKKMTTKVNRLNTQLYRPE